MVDRILAFDGHGNINQYEGGYTDYRNKISGTLEPVNESKEVKVKTEKSQERKRKLSYNEKREYETIDEEIAELESKIEDIEQGIAEKSSDYSELNRLMEEKAELESELEKKMDRWVYLNELVEEIEG